MSCLQRAKREVLPLELALYHAVRQYPGGAAVIAATTGRNATPLQHKLSPFECLDIRYSNTNQRQRKADVPGELVIMNWEPALLGQLF